LTPNIPAMAWLRRRTVNGAHGIAGFVRGAVLVVVLGTAACRQECAGRSIECNGNVLEKCEEGTENDTWLVRSYCKPGACITPAQGTPFCALDKAPDARCSGSDQYVCDGVTLIRCESGYAAEKYDCAAWTWPGPTQELPFPPTQAVDGACTTLNSRAQCVDQAKRDPICLADWQSLRCNGNELVDCRYGYAMQRTACAAEFCLEPWQGHAACFPSNVPDPECAAEREESSYCTAGNTLVTCGFAYRVSERACAADDKCRYFSDGLGPCVSASCGRADCKWP